jgi:hypothetical protein
MTNTQVGEKSRRLGGGGLPQLTVLCGSWSGMLGRWMLSELDSAESYGEASKYRIFGLNLMEGWSPASRDASVTGTSAVLRRYLVLSCPTVVLQCVLGFND